MRTQSNTPKLLRHTVARVIAALLGLMYVASATSFATSLKVNFVGYSAATPLEAWTLRNLAARMLAIGLGMLAGAYIGTREIIGFVLGVRLIADLGDLVNSLTTVGLEASVPRGLAFIVALEVAALTAVLWPQRTVKS